MAGDNSMQFKVKIPEGWKEVALGDLLTLDQLDHLNKLVVDIREMEKPVIDLKTWLVSLRSQMEPKGVLPEYLYYLLCYEFKLSL